MNKAIGNFDKKEHSLAHGLACTDPSLAIQSQKDESDINTIVRNFGVTGKYPTPVRIPSYGDFTEIGSYQECIEAARAAEAEFLKIPAELRARLENNPQRFLEYVGNPANLEEMRKLGLAIVQGGSAGVRASDGIVDSSSVNKES